MKKTFFLSVIALLFVCQVVADEPIGVVAVSNTNCFHLINPLTQDLSPAQLKGELGSYGGGLFDVAITPDGKKAIISNFGDSMIYIIDISGGFYGTPEITGVAYIPFFAEDMDITPDGKFVLVTDGGFSSRVAVIDIANASLVVNYYSGDNQAQAITIAPNGKFFMLADYWNGAIHSYSINAAGAIAFVETQYVNGSRPVNVAISPDGQTAIAVNAVGYNCAVFYVTPEGNFSFQGNVLLSSKSGQSCVFSKDGTKAYYLSSSYNKGPRINIIDITAPGVAASSGYIQMSIPRGTSQLFGVDTLSIDPSGNYLYVSNPTLSGGVVEVTVIDLTTNTEVNQLGCNGIPTGIAFGTISDEVE
jgi:DNA-binding beta-propeller fold protein YncE